MENTLSGVAGKKFILSYSCGKDSTLCLHKMLEAGAEPMALLVMFNPEAGRSYFHGVDPALLKEYGEALELPLLAVGVQQGDFSSRAQEPFPARHGGGAAPGQGAGGGAGVLRGY
mgnify:CR=1 FL=1